MEEMKETSKIRRDIAKVIGDSPFTLREMQLVSGYYPESIKRIVSTDSPVYITDKLTLLLSALGYEIVLRRKSDGEIL